MRKVFAVLTMMLSGVGFVICVVLFIGTVIINEPATRAVTGSIDVVDGYLLMVDQTSEQVDAELLDAQRRFDALAESSPEHVEEVQARLTQELMPLVQNAEGALVELSRGIDGLNQTLAQVDRLPGVDIPTLASELEDRDRRLEELTVRLAELESFLTEADPDGQKLTAAAQAISEQLGTLAAALETWAEQLDRLRASLAVASATTPRVIDLTTLSLAMLLVLLGAGQVSLFLQSLKWFRGSAAP